MLRRLAARTCLAAVCCAMSLTAFAQDFMNVSEVREGMTGYAKTVVHGNTIETFPVEILGVMKNSGPSGDLILAKFSGPLIEETGGIAQGMSGSPRVYRRQARRGHRLRLVLYEFPRRHDYAYRRYAQAVERADEGRNPSVQRQGIVADSHRDGLSW